MKTIGMIGGMSWESSLEYYRLVNEGIKTRLGGLHSAQCLLYSVDFAPVEELQRTANWQQATQVMLDAAQRLERGGADFVIICTNTMHKVADAIQNGITGRLINPHNANALLNAMEDLLNSDKSTLAANCKAWVSQHDWRLLAKQLL